MAARGLVPSQAYKDLLACADNTAVSAMILDQSEVKIPSIWLLCIKLFIFSFFPSSANHLPGTRLWEIGDHSLVTNALKV